MTTTCITIVPAPALTAGQKEALAAYTAVLARSWVERGHNNTPVPPGTISQDEAEKGLIQNGLIPTWKVGHPTLRKDTRGMSLFVDDEGHLIVRVADGEGQNAPDVYAPIGRMADPGPILPEKALLGLVPIEVYSDDGWTSANYSPRWGDPEERAAARERVIEAIRQLS